MQQSTLPPQQPTEPPLNLCEVVPSTERITTSYVPKSIPELEERIRAKAGPDGVETVIGVLCVLKRGGMAFLRNRSCFSSDVTLEPGSYVRAMHGDVVAVQLNPMNMWKPVEKVEDEDEESLAVALSEMPQALPDGRVVYDLVRSRKQQPPPVLPKEVELTQQICGEVRKYTWPSNVKPSGMVICVLHRDIPRYYVGRVAFNAMPQTEPKASFLLRFRLYDPRMPQITVQWKDIPAAYKNDVTSYLFILKLVDAGGMLHLDLKDAYRATIHGCCGMANASSATMGICAQYELPSESFEDDVEACIPADFTVPSSAEELAAMKRRDLRETEFVCTIDPATARDLDDALSIRRTPSGYHVGVHIADVSYFVQRGTPIDEEAARRCTSTYLVNKVISMLPRKLSEDYCSLNPSEDKFAFSALFEVDAKGQIISEWFGQSVIRSRCRLSYEQAQEIVDGKHIELDLAKESAHSNTPEATLSARVHESVLLLYELASIRRAASLLRGRLAIPNARLGFTFDEKDTTFAPTSFHVVRQIRSNWVVEEFMLLANFRTAEKIVQFTPKGAILREHNAPSNEKMKALRESLDGFGIKMVGTSARDLYETIEACQGHPHYDDVCELMKYSMQRAHYVSNSMEASAGGRAHFAIGAPWYTHFTSPIRRYCDIIAHRQLLVALEAEAKMKEMQLTLPSRPDPSIVQDPAKEAIDTATYFAPEDLEYGHLWYSYSEVNEIVIRANDRSRKAKEAGEDSCEVFFCLFLQALQKKAQVDGGIPSVLRTTVVVLQMRNDGMNLYASEVAMNVKVGFKDNKQLFQIKEGDSTTNTKEARKPVDGKAAPPKNKKDKNPAERSTICKLTSTKKILSWGPHPETGVEEEEEIHLCSELVVELIVNTQKKLVVLDMIVRPPWDRKIAQPIPKALFVAE